jgi:flavodoxin
MEALVIYDPKFGNTQKIAEAIGEALRRYGTAKVYGLEKAFPEQFGPIDLLVIGGPTQAHGVSARMRQFTDGIRAGTGMMAATFDTRFRMPAVISGSAAKTIARRLKRAGVNVCVEPESFFVSRGGSPELESGEVERAPAWGNRLASHWALNKWCARLTETERLAYRRGNFGRARRVGLE